GDGAAAEIIAVRETAGQNDGVYVPQTRRIVPDIFRFLAEVGGDCVESVVVAIASGKNNDAKFHEFCLGKTNFYFTRGTAAFVLQHTKPCKQRYPGYRAAASHRLSIPDGET